MANNAVYALHRFHILPHDFAKMEQKEQAFIIACIELKIESDKKEEAKMKGK